MINPDCQKEGDKKETVLKTWAPPFIIQLLHNL